MQVNQKTILFVNHVSSYRGGSEFSLTSTLNALQNENKYLIKVVLPSSGSLVKYIEDKNIDVKIIKDESWRFWYRKKSQLIIFFLSIFKILTNLYTWVIYLKTEQPDVIHVNINRTIIPIIAAKIVRIKVIVHFRDIISLMRYKFVLGEKNYFKIMNFSKIWVANSFASKKDIFEMKKDKKVHVLHNFLDIEKFHKKNQLEKKHEIIDSKKFAVAMVGGISPWKNQLDFIKVAKKILDNRGDVCFYIFGNIISRNYYELLKNEKKKHILKNQIIFGGFINDIPKLLSSIDIILHTTKVESFGRILIESNALSVPVVAYNSGAIPEIIKDGKNGFLVDTDNIDRLASSVIHLLDDKNLRSRLGHYGRSRVMKKYSVNHSIEKLYDIYNDVLSLK